MSSTTRLAMRAARGAIAGIVATGAMTRAMRSPLAKPFVGEPPPRKLVHRVFEKLGMIGPRGAELDAAGTAAHYAFGASLGAVFAFVPEKPSSPILRGALFGLGVWTVCYAGIIPKLGLMPRPSLDRPGRPTAMILAHIVYGIALGRASRWMSATGGEGRAAV